MNVLTDVLAELTGMFMSDARLSAAILSVVAGTALLIKVGRVDPLIGGVVLLLGCLFVLMASVRQAALRAADPRQDN